MADILILSVSVAPDHLARLPAALNAAGLSTTSIPLGADAPTRAQRNSIVSAPVVLLALGRESDLAGVEAAATLAARNGGLAVVDFAIGATVQVADTVPRFDLSTWRGGASNATLLALVRHCEAIAAARRKTAGRRGLRGWLLGGSLGGVVALGFSITGIDLFNVQQQLCGFPGPQPWLSDICGSIGVGDRPTREERLAWERRPAGDCAALVAHIRRFPDGKLVPQAHALYAARTPQRVGRRSHIESVPLQVSLALSGPTDRDTALARGQTQASELCSMYAQNQQFVVTQAVAVPREWLCTADGCSFSGEARCTLVQDEVKEICPTQAPAAS